MHQMLDLSFLFPVSQSHLQGKHEGRAVNPVEFGEIPEDLFQRLSVVVLSRQMPLLQKMTGAQA